MTTVHRLLIEKEAELLAASCQCCRWSLLTTSGDDVSWQYRIHKAHRGKYDRG